MLTTYVLLTIIVWDGESGAKLYETERPMWPREQGVDLIEHCRVIGTNKAYKLTDFWRTHKGYPYAFTNIDCEWHEGSPG